MFRYEISIRYFENKTGKDLYHLVRISKKSDKKAFDYVLRLHRRDEIKEVIINDKANLVKIKIPKYKKSKRSKNE